MAIAEIFSGQVDFDRELQAGRRFLVLFEKSRRNGEFTGYGPILGATFFTDGKDITRSAGWIRPPAKPRTTTKPGDPSGGSSSCRRCSFEPHVTSHFSRSRLHPVHNTKSAAPRRRLRRAVRFTGGGSGGGHGGFGRMGWRGRQSDPCAPRRGIRDLLPSPVVVREGRPCRERRSIRASSSAASGPPGQPPRPHLDFRLRKNGVFVDPVRERRRQPPGQPIPDRLMDAFLTARDDLLRRIAATPSLEDFRPKPDAVRATH